MQISILTLMLALGLPGANSCNAQQQGLPRVGQTPPVATQGEEPVPAVVETEDADEPEEMEADDADDADAEMFEIAGVEAEGGDCPEAQSKSDCQAHCEGSGSCNTGSDPMLGRLMKLRDIGGAESLALDGKVQKLTIQPGSTVIIQAKDGKQVVVRSQGLGGGMASAETFSIPTLGGLFAAGQASKQGNDDRVRELEQRVRELEAQLRERDGQVRTPQPFQLWAPQAHAEARERAEEERAQAREMRERMTTQARDYAKQARRQAEEMRKQAEHIQKQAMEQAEVWRAHAMDTQSKDPIHWKAMKAPRAAVAAPAEPDVFVEVQPGLPSPMAEAAPEVPPAPPTIAVPAPPGGAWWGRAPGAEAPRARVLRTPKPSRSGKAVEPEHAQEMQAMLSDMRRQMDEMREQMQALREELQRAPQRELR